MGSFERKEIKYLVATAQYEQLCRLAKHRLLPPAEYAEGEVLSLYYDTPDWLLVNRSLEKPCYKEKLRVRSYGMPSPESQVFVEIKKKFKGVVYKRRLSCSLAAAKAFLGGMPYEQAVTRFPLADPLQQEESLSWASRQIAGEIAWMLSSYERLQPAMFIRTYRSSLVGVEDPELRVTCDKGVAYRPVDPAFPEARNWQPLIGADQRILEIKCLGAYPLWLVDTLNACNILPQSVSKVGLAYQTLFAGSSFAEVADPIQAPRTASSKHPSPVQAGRGAHPQTSPLPQNLAAAVA